jgi:hypothetical protein
MTQLMALPPELISAIAFHVDDLCSLRLVSRRARSCADGAFIDRFFKHRSHIYTMHSLKVLWEIARNERLRRHLQRLELEFLSVPYLDIEGHLQRCHIGTTCDRLDQSKVDCWEVDTYNNEYDVWDSCTEILDAVLQQLATGRIRPKLVFQPLQSRGYGWETRSWGISALKRSLRSMRTDSRCPTVPPGADVSAVTGSALLAIARSGFVVRDLEIFAWNSEYGAQPYAFHPMAASSLAPWTKLTTLKILIAGACLDAGGDASPFQKWLASLHALESLALTFGDSDESAGTVHPMTVIDAPELSSARCLRLRRCLADKPLRGFEINGGTISPSDLQDMLWQLRAGLEGLQLRNLVFHDQYRWGDVFGWIAQNLSLEEVVFFWNVVGFDDVAERIGYHRSDTMLEMTGNTAAVKQQLEALAERVKHAEDTANDSDLFVETDDSDDDPYGYDGIFEEEDFPIFLAAVS